MSRRQEVPNCGTRKCRNDVVWVRVTQFSGVHKFCEHCAKKEEDFGKGNSYFYWIKFKSWQKQQAAKAAKNRK
jgi:hypothetical protein